MICVYQRNQREITHISSFRVEPATDKSIVGLGVGDDEIQVSPVVPVLRGGISHDYSLICFWSYRNILNGKSKNFEDV